MANYTPLVTCKQCVTFSGSVQFALVAQIIVNWIVIDVTCYTSMKCNYAMEELK